MPLTSGVPGPGKQPTPRAARAGGVAAPGRWSSTGAAMREAARGPRLSVAPQAEALHRGSPAPRATRAPPPAIGRRRPRTPHYAGPVSTPVRLVLGCALLLAAAVLLTVAVLGARGRLRRNPWAGVRTRADAGVGRGVHGREPGGRGPAGGRRDRGAARRGHAGRRRAGRRWSGRCSWSRRRGCWGSPGSAARSATGPRRGWTAPASGCAGTCAGCDLVAGCRPAATDTATAVRSGPRRRPRLTLPSPGCRSTRPIAQLCRASSGNVASSASGTPWRRSTRDHRFGPWPVSTSSGRAGTTNQSPARDLPGQLTGVPPRVAREHAQAAQPRGERLGVAVQVHQRHRAVHRDEPGTSRPPGARCAERPGTGPSSRRPGRRRTPTAAATTAAPSPAGRRAARPRSAGSAPRRGCRAPGAR